MTSNARPRDSQSATDVDSQKAILDAMDRQRPATIGLGIDTLIVNVLVCPHFTQKLFLGFSLYL